MSRREGDTTTLAPLPDPFESASACLENDAAACHEALRELVPDPDRHFLGRRGLPAAEDFDFSVGTHQYMGHLVPRSEVMEKGVKDVRRMLNQLEARGTSFEYFIWGDELRARQVDGESRAPHWGRSHSQTALSILAIAGLAALAFFGAFGLAALAMQALAIAVQVVLAVLTAAAVVVGVALLLAVVILAVDPVVVGVLPTGDWVLLHEWYAIKEPD